MRRTISLVLLACTAVLTLTVPAFAQSAPATPSSSGTSTPPASSSVPQTSVSGATSVDDSLPLGYFVWHDDGGWHLRTHGPDAEHYFTARLHTSGIFDNVDPIKLEPDDQADVLDGGHTLQIKFHTYDGIDGVNYRIDGSDDLWMRAELDGQLISTSNVFLGPNHVNPPTNPFLIQR